jgi:MSHA pilin protein MshD
MYIADSLRRARGFTLPELLLLIVVLAIGLGGILTVYINTVLASADPLARKQALAIAESLMDEIMLQQFSLAPVTAPGATRDTFDEISDYNNYSTAGGIQSIYGVAVPGLGAYNIAPPVTVAGTAVNGVGAADSARITVSVTGPGNVVVTLEGYKLKYP